MQEPRGYNPYKIGFVGGSDSHNSAAPYRQDNFFGGQAMRRRRSEGTHGRSRLRRRRHPRLMNPAGLTAIWAEENTRASLFDGMQRKETFATSGPRIKVRFFGGWDFDGDRLDERDWVKSAYANGVPMGGDLPPNRQARRRRSWSGQ